MKRFRHVALILAVALGTLGLAGHRPARAVTAGSTFMVSATVIQSCTISTTPIAFGNYDPVVANVAVGLDSNGTVTVACTQGTVASLGMGQGGGALLTSTAVAPLRQMSNGAARLQYDLFQDPLRTVVWGDFGTASAMTYTSTGMAAQTINVYGRVRPTQDVPTGVYTDMVLATIQF